MGAAAAEVCYIAGGRFEARIEAYIGPWDIAAGALILMQAGGTDREAVVTIAVGRFVLATNGAMHETLIRLIRE